MTAGTTWTRAMAAWVARRGIVVVVSIIATVLGGVLAPVNQLGRFRAEISKSNYNVAWCTPPG
jgi:hypothetical protein